MKLITLCHITPRARLENSRLVLLLPVLSRTISSLFSLVGFPGGRASMGTSQLGVTRIDEGAIANPARITPSAGGFIALVARPGFLDRHP